jgi:hypothetical protein
MTIYFLFFFFLGFLDFLYIPDFKGKLFFYLFDFKETFLTFHLLFFFFKDAGLFVHAGFLKVNREKGLFLFV